MSQWLPFEDDRPRTGVYVRVALERSIDRLSGAEDAELLYELPPSLAAEPIQVGERVEAPLARAGRVPGVVVEVGDSSLLGDIPPAKVRPLAARPGARLQPDLLDLARWMSSYYVCPLGMTLSSMVPAAVKRGVGRSTRTLLSRDDALLHALLHAPSTLVDVAPLSPSRRRLAQKLALIEPARFPIEPRELAEALECSPRSVRGLVECKVLLPQTGPIARPIADPAPAPETPSSPAEPAFVLTPDQRRVVDAIHPLLDASARAFGVHLIHGITGSGKTEIYLRLLRRALESDPAAGAIVLVPEIALTPQTSRRFDARFADLGVAVLHSGLSASRRHAEWARLASGEARVVVGARSAIFAPLPRLAMIIVDEEHDPSYKQDQLPRYHARNLAIKRAQLAACPILLGSATPSLESLANTRTAPPKATLHTLRSRAGGGTLPAVQIVDLAAERREARALGLGDVTIGPTLRRALLAAVSAGDQALLLLNRRGYATFVGCASSASCEWVMSCDRCDARMILHKDAALRRGELLRCHHCLSEVLVPARCPSCGKPPIRLGSGTQRAEEELAPLLAECRLEPGSLLRVDRDTMRTGADYFDALDRFARREARILLGTQMIAKGLDFPGVSLVGVLNADTGLHLPDFRAGERTFQLISQVAGRAGRADNRGQVIVQTLDPSNPAILAAAAHDYDSFAARELADRRRFSLPPFARLARIVCRDPKRETALDRAQRIALTLREQARHLGFGNGEVRIDGPLTPVLTRVSDHYRFSIELLAHRPSTLQALLQSVRALALLKSDARTAIDVDPVSLL